jgi:alginate O-acetyltransferase complex protein AlgI
VSFASPEFGVFLILALVVWRALPAPRWSARKTFLVVASWVFYMGWRTWPLLLLLWTTGFDFVVGRTLERTRGPLTRQLLVAASICTNLALLGYFKYAGFVADTLAPLIGPRWYDAAEIALPIGISFYTFESLSYVIDVYRGYPASRNLRDFALFLSFFPHLVAGPIVRPRQFFPQLAAPTRVTASDVEDALARIVTGFVKKLWLADTLATTVDVVFARPDLHGGIPVLVAMYAYAFQIYFDFSGYTDIALGTARLFGFVLPENFDRPYAAASLREFWQRWHISLSTWLRDYLYIPLGGNRRSRWATTRNILITMLLGGLWHGAAGHFVVWGGYHGVLLVAERATGRRTPAPSGLLRRLVTFHLVVLGWVLFRSPSLADAVAVFRALGTPAPVAWRELAEPVALVAFAAVLHAGPRAALVRQRFVSWPAWQQGLAHAAIILTVTLLAPGVSPFIYFQF